LFPLLSPVRNLENQNYENHMQTRLRGASADAPKLWRDAPARQATPARCHQHARAGPVAFVERWHEFVTEKRFTDFAHSALALAGR
jgi:hypothetical protein